MVYNYKYFIIYSIHFYFHDKNNFEKDRLFPFEQTNAK